MTRGDLIRANKERTLVKARALSCYWAVYELEMSMTDVSRHLKSALSTVSVALKKGPQIAHDSGWN